VIKEMLKECPGCGGKSVTGTQTKPDSSSTVNESATKSSEPQGKGGAGHLAQLKTHAGEAVARGGSSPAGSGSYRG
jgi:hypothetical protein